MDLIKNDDGSVDIYIRPDAGNGSTSWATAAVARLMPSVRIINQLISGRSDLFIVLYPPGARMTSILRRPTRFDFDHGQPAAVDPPSSERP
jgi:hypothetical protein